jgi:hypothetical protein
MLAIFLLMTSRLFVNFGADSQINVMVFFFQNVISQCIVSLLYL